MDTNDRLISSITNTLNGFPNYLGIELDEVTREGAKLHLDMRPEYLNVQLIPHGGIIATLIDEVAGVAVFYYSGGKRLVSRGADLHFLKSSTDSRLYASAKVIQCGRRTALAAAEVRDSNGTLLATGNVDLHFI